ncbi:hypothetical protein GGR58DRAFT_153639 [Xylaria digitata]|nr:hypothetical protein GGR58DRAFT_153639 [Xylaria digitata]
MMARLTRHIVILPVISHQADAASQLSWLVQRLFFYELHSRQTNIYRSHVPQPSMTSHFLPTLLQEYPIFSHLY